MDPFDANIMLGYVKVIFLLLLKVKHEVIVKTRMTIFMKGRLKKSD